MLLITDDLWDLERELLAKILESHNKPLARAHAIDKLSKQNYDRCVSARALATVIRRINEGWTLHMLDVKHWRKNEYGVYCPGCVRKTQVESDEVPNPDVPGEDHCSCCGKETNVYFKI